MAPARRVHGLALLLASSLALGACVEDGEGMDGADGTSGLPDPAENPDPMVVPTDADSLLEWLVAEPYLDWPSESAIHPSAGPHFGNVRTWIHPALMGSLDAGNDQHPAGVAAVKELYGDGQSRQGWAVEVKLADDSEMGDQWYWYEYYQGSVVAQGDGIALCTGCHASGMDYVRTPYPLQ